MRIFYRLVGIFLILGLTATPSLGKTPLGGLGVAISPNGQTIAVAGDNRVLYVIDAASLEVKQRVWLKTTVYSLHFNKNGSKLLVEDTDDTVQLIDTQTWKVEKDVKKAYFGSPSAAADLFPAFDDNYNGHNIRFLSMTDLAEKGKVTFEKGQKVQACGLSADGTRLAVLMESVKDESEPTAKETPKDLKGLAAEEFKLKNDGKIATLLIFQVPSGQKLSENKLFYSPSSSGWKVFFSGEDVFLVNYSNLNAKVAKDGQVTMFQLGNSYNYGIGISGFQKVLMSGGLADGTYTQVDGLKMSTFKLERIPGWPEYFKDFAVGLDGSAYGTTSGFRLAKILATGQVEKVVPIF